MMYSYDLNLWIHPGNNSLFTIVKLYQNEQFFFCFSDSTNFICPLFHVPSWTRFLDLVFL
jgi:hypothetical protein